MILHNLFSVLILTAFVGILFPGHSALAASNLQSPIETLSLPDNDLAFLQQITTRMDSVFNLAQEAHSYYFPDGRFYTSHLVLDDTALAYIYAHHDYLAGVTSLNATFDLSHCSLPQHSIETLQNWSADEEASTFTFIRTVLHAEKLRARRCARLIADIKQKYADLEELRLELWNMPFYGYDLTPTTSCPRLIPMPTQDSSSEDVEAWEACLSSPSCWLKQAVASVCVGHEQQLTAFQRDMKILTQTTWVTHIWQDSALNYPQRIARSHNSELEISNAASLIAGMDNGTLEEHLPALTAYCKALRDRAMDSSASSGGYTVSQWAADHVDKWTVWSQKFQIGRAIGSRLEGMF
jgi:hypothetical protein